MQYWLPFLLGGKVIRSMPTLFQVSGFVVHMDWGASSGYKMQLWHSLQSTAPPHVTRIVAQNTSLVPRLRWPRKGNVSRFAFCVLHFAFRVLRFVSMGGAYVGWVSCSQVCTIIDNIVPTRDWKLHQLTPDCTSRPCCTGSNVPPLIILNNWVGTILSMVP